MPKASGDASLDCGHGVGCVEEVARHETRSTVRRGGPWHRRGVARHRTAMSCGAGAVCRGSMDARDSETRHRLYVRGTEEASDCNGLRCWSVLRGRSVAELTDCTVFAAGSVWWRQRATRYCIVSSCSGDIGRRRQWRRAAGGWSARRARWALPIHSWLRRGCGEGGNAASTAPPWHGRGIGLR